MGHEMMKSILTDNLLEQLKPRDVRFRIQDHQAKGLYIEVGIKGARTWLLVGRDAFGVHKNIRLGTYPEMTLAQAREEAVKAGAAMSWTKDAALKLAGKISRSQAKLAELEEKLAELAAAKQRGVRHGPSKQPAH